MERDSLNRPEFTPLLEGELDDSSSEENKKKKKKSRKTPDQLKIKKHQVALEAQKSETELLTIEQLGQLSEVEQREIAKLFLKIYRQEVAREIEESSSEEQAIIEAALAADAYLETVEEKLDSEPLISVNEAAETAYQDTIVNLPPEARESSEENLLPRSASQKMDVRGKSNNENEAPAWLRGAFPLEQERWPSSPVGVPAPPESPIRKDKFEVEAKTKSLVNSISSYLVNRRQQRLKSDRQLIPIRKKLEQEINTLRVNIMEKETVVRKLVREQANSLQPEKHEAAKVRSEQSPDRLGFLTIKATETRPEASSKLKNAAPEVVTNLAQLLEASEKITVGDTTLRKVYETKLISERGLRRAINAYRRGGDVRRILAEELLIKEIGFELDPQLRDRPIRSSQLASSKVKIQNLNPDTSVKIEKDAALFESSPATPLPVLKPAIKRKGQPVLIMANIVAVIILLILVLVLLITRK